MENYNNIRQNAKPATLRNRSLSEFVDAIHGKDHRRVLRQAVISGPYQITRSMYHKDCYYPSEGGIPIWRLAIYCRLLGVTVTDFINFCGFTATVSPIFETPYATQTH